MIQDEIAAGVAPLFPQSTLEWVGERVLSVDTPILDNPARPNQRAREVLLRFEPYSWDEFTTMPTADRTAGIERLREYVRREMVRYDDGRNEPPDAIVVPFEIHCGEVLVD